MIGRIIIDGAARVPFKESKGLAAAAAVFYKNNREFMSAYRGLGYRTNNEAEYEALILALTCAASMEFQVPTIYTDSAVVFNQVERNWKCKSPHLRPLLYTVEIIRKEFQFRLIQVDRKKVQAADRLCNDFLDRFHTYNEREVV